MTYTVTKLNGIQTLLLSRHSIYTPWNNTREITEFEMVNIKTSLNQFDKTELKLINLIKPI